MADTHLLRMQSAFSCQYRQFEFISAETCPETLVKALTSSLPHIPGDSWASRLQWGGVYINGLLVTSDQTLYPPVRIEYFEPRGELETLEERFPRFKPESHVLFEDDDLIVAFKPAKLSSHVSREQRHYSLFASLQRYTGCTVHMPSRLDFSTCGLLIASKSPRMHAPLQHLFERKQIRKTYLAVVNGVFPHQEYCVDAPIGKDPRHSVLRKVTPNGKPAMTDVVLVSHFGRESTALNSSLVAARPRTGRTHQIRVHLAHLGFPLVGDNFYDGPEGTELCLASYALRFQHPFTGDEIAVSLPAHLFPGWLVTAAANLRLPDP